LSRTSFLTLCSNRNSTTLKYPLAAAMCNGVAPWESYASRSPPLATIFFMSTNICFSVAALVSSISCWVTPRLAISPSM
jgi:hypothetical protein